jgi:hypothetical protein
MVIQLQLGWTWIQHDPAALRKSVLEIFQFSSHSTSISVIFHIIPPVFPRSFSGLGYMVSSPRWCGGGRIESAYGQRLLSWRGKTMKNSWATEFLLRKAAFFSKHKWRVCNFLTWINHVCTYTHYISSSWMIWWMSVVGWNCLHLMSTVMELDDGPKPTNDGLELSCGNDT